MQQCLILFADDDQPDRRSGVDGAKPLLVLAQLLLGLFALGDIGIDRDEAAARHRIAPHFEHRAVGTYAFE